MSPKQYVAVFCLMASLASGAMAEPNRPPEGSASVTVQISLTIPPPAESPAHIRECANSLEEGVFRSLSAECSDHFEVSSVARSMEDGRMRIAPI